MREEAICIRRIDERPCLRAVALFTYARTRAAVRKRAAESNEGSVMLRSAADRAAVACNKTPYIQ